MHDKIQLFNLVLTPVSVEVYDLKKSSFTQAVSEAADAANAIAACPVHSRDARVLRI